MRKNGASCDRQMVLVLVVGIAGGCLMGFLLGWVWRDRPDAWASVRLLDALTAIGTCGAAIVAGWLGVRAVRHHSSEKEARAKFAATLLAPVFADCMDAVVELRLMSPESYSLEGVGVLMKNLKFSDSQIDLVRDLESSHFEQAAYAIRNIVTACTALELLRSTSLKPTDEVAEFKRSVVRRHLKRAHHRLHRLLGEMGVLVLPLKKEYL